MDLFEHDRYEWVWPEDLVSYQPVPPNFVDNVTTIWQSLRDEYRKSQLSLIADPGR